MQKLSKCITAYILTIAVIFGTFMVSYDNTYAYNILYNQKKSEIVTKGVKYELSRRLLDEGWLDVHVLTVNIEDETINLAPVQSNKEMGLKETLADLLYTNGSIAGVNSDFFGLKGTYSAAFGIAMEDGKILSTSDDRNINSNDYSTFFIDSENSPFMDFLKINFQFLNDGVKNIDVNAINKVGDQLYALKLDRNGAVNTQSLDNRFLNLVKLVVEDDVITYISLKGETVNVPENGYLIVINEQWYDEKAELFKVGQSAEFIIDTNVDLNNIKTAISGGSKILNNGIAAEKSSASVSPNSRQPRTAIGITEDRKNIILMVVDGRNHSIGATQNEMADLLLEYGAYNAMNFDGGGSSTMVVKTIDDQWVNVKNTLSDGSQRRIINGFGVFNNSAKGNMVELVVKPEQEKVFKGTPVKINTYGYDQYYNPINLDSVILSASDKDGKWEGQYFYPSISGNITITATAGEFTANSTIKSLDTAEIRANMSTVNLEVGESVYIELSGVDYDGFKANIDLNRASFEVEPMALGTIENGRFIAVADGSGYIKCTVGNAVRYIPVIIGSNTVPINSFENLTTENLSYSSYPENLVGNAEVSSEITSDGQKALRLNYTFEVADDSTQAAYLDFKQPIELMNNPTNLIVDIYGDNSENWLRGRIIDANGKNYTIDFAKQLNWEGWKQVKAKLPSDVKYPIKLERIYVASLSNGDISPHTIYIDNMKGVYSLKADGNIPDSTKFVDKKQTNLSNIELPNSYDITVLPTITVPDEVRPQNYAEVQGNVFEKFKTNSVLGVFAGNANVESGTGIIKYTSSYSVNEYSNTGIIQMTAKNGGLRNTDPVQWKVFENDINALNKDNIIIVLDKNPLNFTDELEKNLFKEILENISDSGKNIFVISSEGESTWVSVSNGVRYINLGSLFKLDGSVNEKFKMLRFRISGNTIYYDFQ